ncbi:MAG TPA: ABC transporter ATP-binding protein [Solirubrobacteraceae bacterium]|jgi:ABC-2 type transport system ATP-binding protein|nr:ABC transporter ATP-binding protein [Solirubrobacteraceae bacterium]
MSVGTPARPLAVRGVTKRFGTRVALQSVSFELSPGELVGIVGPNGAGKTTLLSILAGVLSPDEGELTISGRGAGWVPQHPALYSKLSVAENLRLFARLEKLPDPEAAVTRMLTQTDLGDRADEEVGKLSGGNRQRVNIAIGLLSEPALLLLDEPSASLDPRQRERLWEFISALGTTVVFSTHDVGEVERYATRVLLLADGELLFTGTPGQLEQAVAGGVGGVGGPDLESALVSFLHLHGH